MKKIIFILVLIFVFFTASNLFAQNNNDSNGNSNNANNSNNNDTNTINENGDDIVNDDISADEGDKENNDSENDGSENSEGSWGLVFELPGVGVGGGPGFTKAYGLIMPGQETKFQFYAGAIIQLGEPWFGIGNDLPTIPNNPNDPDKKMRTSAPFFDLYLRGRMVQVILGDHYSEDYWFDAAFETFNTFRLPIYDSENDPIFQNDLIRGELSSHFHKLMLFLEFDYSDDPEFEFWTTSGFHFLSQFYMNLGSEYDSEWWAYLGNYTRVDGWIPIVNRFFFIHAFSVLDVITESLNENAIPYYAYAKVSQGNWNAVRGFATSYRGTASLTGSIELKTRPLEFYFDGNLGKAFSFMSLGAGVWTDIGFVTHPLDYPNSITSDNLTRASMGVFLEYKIQLLFDLLRLTVHLGGILFTNENGSFDFNPGIYFAFG